MSLLRVKWESGKEKKLLIPVKTSRRAGGGGERVLLHVKKMVLSRELIPAGNKAGRTKQNKEVGRECLGRTWQCGK
jgi:hypothetical protein